MIPMANVGHSLTWLGKKGEETWLQHKVLWEGVRGKFELLEFGLIWLHAGVGNSAYLFTHKVV